MKIINAEAHFNRQYYRIDNRGEFENIIEMIVKDAGWVLSDKSYLGIVQENRVKGSRIQPTIAYPYAVVLEVDDEHECIIVDYIELSEFVAEEGGKHHLYEFELRRTDRESPYTVRETTYQVPAQDIFKAMAVLGRAHHRAEVYDLEVVSWKQIH